MTQQEIRKDEPYRRIKRGLEDLKRTTLKASFKILNFPFPSFIFNSKQQIL